MIARVAGGPSKAPSLDPTKPLEIAETRSQVLAALDRLSDSQRLALEWKYVENLSTREIAIRFGQTEKAVESILFRARNRFREQAAQVDQEETTTRRGTPAELVWLAFCSLQRFRFCLRNEP